MAVPEIAGGIPVYKGGSGVAERRQRRKIQAEEFKAKEFKELCPRSGSPGIYVRG